METQSIEIRYGYTLIRPQLIASMSVIDPEPERFSIGGVLRVARNVTIAVVITAIGVVSFLNNPQAFVKGFAIGYIGGSIGAASVRR